ncbi:MAG: nucleotide exchange factor GrpE [Deltaproteobacteria bacterium]|nr:nucleotide exchange factor GrpE [Deltaproteobacteria bacterium]
MSKSHAQDRNASNGSDAEQTNANADATTRNANANANAAQQSEASVEEVVAELAPETPESKRIAELERELLATQEKLRQYSTAVDRARTEFDAARSRLEREQARVVEAQKVAAVGGLLSVLDSLDQALHNVGDGGMAFIQGVAMIRQPI